MRERSMLCPSGPGYRLSPEGPTHLNTENAPSVVVGVQSFSHI